MMETKTFKQGDKFTWEGELFIMSRPPLLRGLLACGSQGTTIGENKVRSLLAGGLIAIHREVPDEPVADHDYQRLLEYASVMSNYPLNSEDWASSVTRILTVLISKVKP